VSQDQDQDQDAGFDLPERFELRRVLARTDAEVLIQAYDHELEREVVLKVAGPAMEHAMRTSDGTDRALREARTLARVRHPGVPRVLDVLTCELGPLVVTEPVEGESLAQRLRTKNRLPLDEVYALGFALADALHAVHAVSVVHRNVCTESIILRPDDTPCLTGFRLAKFELGGSGTSIMYPGGTDGNASQSATFIAEDGRMFEAAASLLPAHPAPEQLMGLAADERCDVFGAGCVLYDTLTGTLAYPQDDPGARMPPEAPHKVAKGVPRKLSKVVMAALELRPAERLRTARELGEALKDAARGAGPMAWFKRRKGDAGR